MVKRRHAGLNRVLQSTFKKEKKEMHSQTENSLKCSQFVILNVCSLEYNAITTQ